MKGFALVTILIAAATATRSPVITDPPTNQVTVDEQTVQLTCRVFGAPKPLVKWHRNNIELTGGRYTVHDNGDLEIRDVNFLDAGQYTCYAENRFGQAEDSGSLTVKEHTRITDCPENYEVTVGTSATFRCSAESDSSLDLSIDWLHNGEPIDVESDSRFVRSSENSLTIIKTTELDSGTYTCRASTQLDEKTAQATLTVQDVPNPPRLSSVQCQERMAELRWQPMGDNRSPILRYSVQYNTGFTQDTWEVAFESVPASEITFTVAMSPWSNYTFRVIAWNKIGPSVPSEHSPVCSTQPDVPFKNPDNVEGKGTKPNNIVIKWTAMPMIEHNAQRFMYFVFWKRDIVGETWNLKEIPDWKQSELLIPNQPPFQQYRIKVLARNEKGAAKVAPKEVIGYSGEEVPIQAPSNFTVLQVGSSTNALLSWSAVPVETLRGHFKGYKIQTWTDKEGEENMREIHVKKDSTRELITKFVPNSKNFARILVYNGQYNGPPSETVNFDTPEGVPGTVRSFAAHQLGSSALYLIWEQPEQTNGNLTGYRIYYQAVKGTKMGPLLERRPLISNPKQTRAKLAGLEPRTKYRLTIAATTRAGEGESYFIEQRTRATLEVTPDKPQFDWYLQPSDDGYASVKVVWIPNLDGKPGSHFYIQHRQKGESTWTDSSPQLHEDYDIVRGLLTSNLYEFRVVAVDGDFSSTSELKEVDTTDID